MVPAPHLSARMPDQSAEPSLKRVAKVLTRSGRNRTGSDLADLIPDPLTAIDQIL